MTAGWLSLRSPSPGAGAAGCPLRSLRRMSFKCERGSGDSVTRQPSFPGQGRPPRVAADWAGKEERRRHRRAAALPRNPMLSARVDRCPGSCRVPKNVLSRSKPKGFIRLQGALFPAHSGCSGTQPRCFLDGSLAIFSDGSWDGHYEMTEQPGRPSIAVLVPCYNEEAAVGGVVRRFLAALPGSTVYVYDTTPEIARRKKPERQVRSCAGRPCRARDMSCARCSPTSMPTSTCWWTAMRPTRQQPLRR